MAAPAMVSRKPQSHRGKLSALRASGCQGKSKFFLEHQAMREKEQNKGYDPSVHSWRFTEPAPLPRGTWKNLNYTVVLDEQAKEEKARLGREEKQLLVEKQQQLKRVEEELQRRKKQFAPGKAPSDKQLRKELFREDRLARAEERHVKNVQMALRAMNRSYPDRKYELTEITDRCTFFEIGSAYSHYNFTAHSPTHGNVFFFAETFPDAEREYDVYQCCTMGSGPYGDCMGCLKQRVGVTHPGNEMFIGGQEYESIVEFLADSDSDEEY